MIRSLSIADEETSDLRPLDAPDEAVMSRSAGTGLFGCFRCDCSPLNLRTEQLELHPYHAYDRPRMAPSTALHPPVHPPVHPP